MAFEAPYAFARDEVEVVIETKHGKFLRVDPQNEDGADPNGGKGGFARWIVERVDGGAKCKLKSKKTGKYLRIKKDAAKKSESHIDVGGAGGKWTVFNVQKQGDAGLVKLESAEQPGLFLAVQQDGVLRVGGGGQWCELKFQREKIVEFSKTYQFAKLNQVVIQHKGGGDFDKFLRIDPNDQDAVDPNGGKGAFAQWEADPQDGGAKVRFKSLKSGKYLRIVDGGKKVDVGGGGGKFTIFKVQKEGDGIVKLESAEFPEAYLAIGKNNVPRVGKGGPWCELKIFRR